MAITAETVESKTLRATIEGALTNIHQAFVDGDIDDGWPVADRS